MFAYFTIHYFSIVPNGRYFVEELQFRFILRIFGFIIPVQKLQWAIENNRQSQLMARSGFHYSCILRFCKALLQFRAMVITNRMVCSTCDKTGERKNSTVGCIGHFLVAMHTFLR